MKLIDFKFVDLPAAFLQAPNFDKDRPASMNYGAIGSVVAHEITHGFDRLLEKETKQVLEQYKNKVKCIIDQYSSFKDPDIKVLLNGTVTAREDVADNGGLKLAYRAYQKWKKTKDKTEQNLIAISFKPKQLFWISYAQFYCTVARKEQKIALLESKDEHSFDRFRVIGPLTNSIEFATDFECSTKSQMNLPRERCSIW